MTYGELLFVFIAIYVLILFFCWLVQSYYNHAAVYNTEIVQVYKPPYLTPKPHWYLNDPLPRNVKPKPDHQATLVRVIPTPIIPLGDSDWIQGTSEISYANYCPCNDCLTRKRLANTGYAEPKLIKVVNDLSKREYYSTIDNNLFCQKCQKRFCMCYV